MPAPTEEDIRKRAYHLWKSAGKPNGNPDDFWYQAEKRDTQGKRGAGLSAAWHDRQSSYLSIRVNTRFELISPFATGGKHGSRNAEIETPARPWNGVRQCRQEQPGDQDH